MVIIGVLIKAYAIMTFATAFDEAWNINNPRPYPAQKYFLLQWEEKDFYKNIHGHWILRPKRITDSELKKEVRIKYWEVLNVKTKKANL